MLIDYFIDGSRAASATFPVRCPTKICIPERWIHVDIAELIGRDRAEVQPPRLVTATVCAHQAIIDARLAMLACPTSPPPQARIFLGDVHSDSNSSFVRITGLLRGHRSEHLEMPQAVFFGECAGQAKSVTFRLWIGREPNRIGLKEWPYLFRANIAATKPLPHNAFQEFGASEVIQDHNLSLSRTHRIASGAKRP
jgi:hypothetical protein